MDSIDILLIHPPYHRRRGSGTVFPIGLGYLAAAAKNADFNVSILDCALYINSLHDETMNKFRNWLTKHLKKSAPRLAIGIGPCTTPAVRALKIIAQVCKDICPSVPLIYGGPLASISGQESIFFEDFSATAIVPGDGELVLCNILSALRDKKPLEEIEGITTKNIKAQNTNIIINLDSLPFPIRTGSIYNGGYSLSTRRDLFAEPFATMVTSRGCPYGCDFCISGNLRNGLYHRRSMDNIIAEIEHIYRSFQIRTIVFYDDTLFPSPNNLEKDVDTFTSAMKLLNKNIFWQIEMRPNILLAMNKNIARYLFDAGCRQINIGIEKKPSGNIDSLSKGVNHEETQDSLKRILEGAPQMRLTGTFILGGADETYDTIKDTIDYSTSLGLLFAHFYPLKLYPGTPLYEQTIGSRDKLWWYKEVISSDLPWGEIVYENKSLDRKTLLNSINIAYSAFYNNDNWHKLARRMFGKQYNKVARVVSTWSSDRFNLTQGNI